MTLELERREAEVATLRSNTVLHKIELRQQALQELAAVRGEARVKMLAVVENATKGAPGGAFTSDKLTRIADLEDAISALKIEKGELEATVAKLQTVFKLRVASRASASAREIRDRSAGALAAEREAVVAREAAEGRLAIASRQLAATQAALGQYRARLSRAEGDLDHVTRNKSRLQRERVAMARENATLKEDVANLERRRVMASSGQTSAAAGGGMRGAFGGTTTTTMLVGGSGGGEADPGRTTTAGGGGSGRPGTAGAGSRLASAVNVQGGAGGGHGGGGGGGGGETASRRIAELEREVDLLRAEAAIAATAAEEATASRQRLARVRRGFVAARVRRVSGGVASGHGRDSEAACVGASGTVGRFASQRRAERGVEGEIRKAHAAARVVGG